jgi:hypothetical protein
MQGREGFRGNVAIYIDEETRLHNEAVAPYKAKDRPSGKYGGQLLVLLLLKATSLFDALRLLLRLPFFVGNF